MVCIENWADEKDLSSRYTMYDEESGEGNPNPLVLYERNLSADPYLIWSLLSLKLRSRKEISTNGDEDGGGDYFSLDKVSQDVFLKLLESMVLKYNK
jgi:hypothetical protein